MDFNFEATYLSKKAAYKKHYVFNAVSRAQVDIGGLLQNARCACPYFILLVRMYRVYTQYMYTYSVY